MSLWRSYWRSYRWHRGECDAHTPAQHKDPPAPDKRSDKQLEDASQTDQQPALPQESGQSKTPQRIAPLKKSASTPGTRNPPHTNTISPANGPCPWGKVVPIAKRESSKRLVLGEVYVPYDPADPSTVDSQGHATTAAEIEQAAHAFLQESRQNQVDVQHNGQCGYGCVVESYLARQGDPSFTPGAWVVGIRVTDDATWQAIEKGDITGISLMGNAQLVPAAQKDTLQQGVPQGDAAQPLEAV